MLIEFSVRNFRSFKERATWSLVASAADKTTREEENVIVVPEFGLRLLKSAVVYGANASGKSKLIESMTFMRDFVRNSSKESQADEEIDVEPFLLNPTAAVAPSEFEIQFIHEKELYRYGFEVSAQRIEAEWLFVRTAKAQRNKPEIELFYRTGQEVENSKTHFSGIVEALKKSDSIRENALLLSVAAQFNQPRARAILKWFSNLKIISGLNDMGYRGFTIKQFQNPVRKQAILELLAKADLDIEDVKEVDASEFASVELSDDTPEPVRRMVQQQFADVSTVHRAYNDAREAEEVVEFSLKGHESSGTQKFLALTGPLLDVTERAAVLVVDELDSRLHPNLVCRIVQLFNSRQANPHNAQLLFNTQDTNLLSSGGFRRDQIWFTEKNRYGETTLYSLADFKTDQVRKDDNFEANYVRGKYGAVPYLGDFSLLPNVDTTSTIDHEE
jgi:AAA15 family ATPase/GTPase